MTSTAFAQTDQGQAPAQLTQRDRLLEYFKTQATGGRATADQITHELHISQYNARILELRARGHVIEPLRVRDEVTGRIHRVFEYRGMRQALQMELGVSGNELREISVIG